MLTHSQTLIQHCSIRFVCILDLIVTLWCTYRGQRCAQIFAVLKLIKSKSFRDKLLLISMHLDNRQRGTLKQISERNKRALQNTYRYRQEPVLLACNLSFPLSFSRQQCMSVVLQRAEMSARGPDVYACSAQAFTLRACVVGSGGHSL